MIKIKKYKRFINPNRMICPSCHSMINMVGHKLDCSLVDQRNSLYLEKYGHTDFKVEKYTMIFVGLGVYRTRKGDYVIISPYAPYLIDVDSIIIGKNICIAKWNGQNIMRILDESSEFGYKWKVI